MALEEKEQGYAVIYVIYVALTNQQCLSDDVILKHDVLKCLYIIIFTQNCLMDFVQGQQYWKLWSNTPFCPTPQV